MSLTTTRLKTVLIADDERHVARVVKLSLQQLGCRVKIVESGLAALSTAASERIDLLIVDISMPGLDGFETVRRIKETVRYAELPVIVLTGSGDAGVRLEAESIGIAAFLTKPFSPMQLERQVKTLLDL